MTLIFCGTAALILAVTIGMLWHVRWVRRLPSLDEFAALPESRIRCSVIIAARDEEARIEQTLRHLLAQRGVDAQYIVVDDRSTDRTSEILRRLAKEDARVQVKRVDVLPEGWLGKCHACHVGALTATGEWLLFTDADCWLTPHMIARAVRLAERDGIDHVTLTSGLSSKRLDLKALHLAFLMSVANWFTAVNRDRPRAYLGFGAFNLVRAAAYRQCGGYEALRLTVLDDMRLGLLLRRAGKRTRGFIGGEDAECHWGTSIGGMVKLTEKNFFAALDFRLWLVLLSSAALILLGCTLVLALMTGTAAGIVAACSPLSLILPAGILARRVGWSWPCGVLAPFMLPVLFYAQLNSTLVTLRQGGIRWRETFYSLTDLRSGGVK